MFRPGSLPAAQPGRVQGFPFVEIPGGDKLSRIARAAAASAAMTMMLLAAPGPAAAQLGAVEALLRNATDLSF